MMLYNYLHGYELKNFQFDFIVHGDNIGNIEKKMNDNFTVFHVTPRRKSVFKNMREIKNIIKKGHYDIVHSHINHMSFIPLYYAKKYKVPIRIIHSHGSNNNPDNTKKLRDKIYRRLNYRYANQFWSCGIEAGISLYGETWKENENKHIMNNAIDLNKFAFNPLAREEYRLKFNLSENDIVLTYVSRLDKGKNHEFIINLLNQLPENYKFWIVGDGPRYRALNELTNEQKVLDRIYFWKSREDVSEILSASDLFVFPSLSEGLGMVAIEAQANGLSVIASPGVPKEVAITPLVKHIKLNEDKWLKAIKENVTIDRYSYIDQVKENGYSIELEREKYFDKIKSLINK